MPCDDIAISVRDLTKTYRIFGHPGDRIKQAMTLGLRKYHREFTAIKDVSFDIKKGETVGIIGSNGSGKSTLLQLICGVLKPTSGMVEVNGRVSALLELGAGFNPEFTGRENVYFQGALMGMGKEVMDRRFNTIVSFADIGEFIDQPVRSYSSGMFVRLAFAAMTQMDADILIIDEALSVGDVVFAGKCMRFLDDFRRRGTVILVSHDLQAITSFSDKVFWLEQGAFSAVGDANEVCDSYLTSILGMPLRNHTGKEPQNKPRLDQRQTSTQQSTVRNDIEVNEFNYASSAAGTGCAQIVDVSVENDAGIAYSWLVGGDLVTLVVRGVATEKISSPIIGFVVKNRQGQAVFGENTYLSYADMPVMTNESEAFEGRFRFRMPLLPVGDYVVTATVAEGTQENSVIHHILHEAVIFRSHTSSVRFQALLGLPMREISLNVISGHETEL